MAIDLESDEKLAARLSHGDHYALSLIISRYQDPLSRYIRRRCFSCHSEIEDILQDVFLKVFSHIHDFDTGLSFSAWIYRITHNQMVSRIRKSSVRSIEESFDESLLPTTLFSANGPHEIAELNKHLKEIQEKMDAKLRDVFVLRFLEEKDYAEISDILKENLNTVATRVRRAREFVMGELLRYGIHFILEDT